MVLLDSASLDIMHNVQTSLCLRVFELFSISMYNLKIFGSALNLIQQ